VSLVTLACFLRWWRPRTIWRHGDGSRAASPPSAERNEPEPSDAPVTIAWAWAPWAFVSLAVLLWGLPPVEALLEGRGPAGAWLPTAVAAPEFAVPWPGIPWRRAGVIWLDNLQRIAEPLLTIAAMLGLAFVTRYSGTDATLGLALTQTGSLYPFFATLLGWLGVRRIGR
jgi:lactate permease